MKRTEWRRRGGVLTLLAGVAVAAVGARATTEAQSATATTTGDWSPATAGVRGRLIATATMDEARRPQVRLELELENVNDIVNPIEIWWTSLDGMIDWALEDEIGSVVPKFQPGGNEFRPPSFWFQLLRRSSTRIMVSEQIYQYLADGRVMMRPTAFQGWTLVPPTASKLFLRGTLMPTDSPQPRDRPWRGPLVLPRVGLPTASGLNQ